MMTLEEMQALLKESIPGKRYKHSVNVYETALKLAEAHGLPKEKIAVSALLHDCGREVPSKDSVAKCQELGLPIDAVELHQPILLHAKLGVYNAMHKYGVADQEILDGILYHTTGIDGMTKPAKVVYLADMIEPSRDFSGVEELRNVSKDDLDKAMLNALTHTIKYLLEKGCLIDINTMKARNYLLYNNYK